MRLSKRRRQNVMGVDMTPMIDVVFNLLIFFMTVSQVSRANREQLELPKLRGSEDQQASTLTINVTREGQIIVSGKEMTAASLATMVVAELGRRGEDAGRLTVVVRGDERGDCRTVNRVVGTLARLGVNRVRVAVQVPKG